MGDLLISPRHKPDRGNLAGVSTLTGATLSGTVHRVVRAALRDSILSTEGNRHFPGRYHSSGETGILYTSLSEQVAMGEIERHTPPGLLVGGLIAGRIRIALTRVLDLTDEANLQAIGLSESDLVSPDYSVTQAISVQARKAGFQGLVVPSATGQGKNLLVFANNLGEGCLVEIVEIRDLD